MKEGLEGLKNAIRLVPYWNVNSGYSYKHKHIVEIRLVPYWNVNVDGKRKRVERVALD